MFQGDISILEDYMDRFFEEENVKKILHMQLVHLNEKTEIGEPAYAVMLIYE